MGTSIYIQNKLHDRIGEITDFDDGALVSLIRNAPAESLTRSIHRNADTMFNMYQLELFEAELGATIPANDAEKHLISTLRAAAESAVKRHGYLWFSGD